MVGPCTHTVQNLLQCDAILRSNKVECSEQDNFAMLPCSQRGGSVSIPMVGHVTSHVMEPSHVPSEPNTPPALLGREGPPRPNEISKLGLNRVQFLPEHLARYPVSEIPVDQLGLYALEPGHARRLLKYSVFDRQRHHQQRTAAYGWSLNDLVSEAVRSSDERVKVAQVLTTTLPQLAVPQIVLTPAEAAHNQLCVPIDMRPLGGRPCTLLLESGMPAPTVISEAFRVCPAGPFFAPPDGEVRNLFLVDAQGNVWEELPADLAQLQWLRVQGRRPFDVLQPQLPEPQFGPSIRLPPAAATTLTTTWVMEQQNVQTISFILAGLGSTIRLHPQHVSQARVAESIADLVLAMARQRGLPPRARVALVAAQPMPLMIQHIALLFVIYPDDGRRHIILDPSGDGSMAQSISVDEQTRPEELLAEAQRRQNYVISVNGIPHSAMRRCIQTGDYVQVIHSPRRHRVSPTDWYYQIFPDLRLFAFAIEIPRLQRATAAPLDALVQTQVRDGLLRYLHPRLAQQRESMGQPAADTQPVFIHGPGHAPALLYVPGRILPVLAEVEESIHATGLFQPHTTFVDSCQVTHMHAPLFLSVPAGMSGLGVFVPAPAFLMGYHLMWVTAEMDPATLPLPVHRNFILIYPSTLVQAATVRHRRIANNPAATPREASEGTSLLQLPAYAVQRRQAPLREPQVETLPPQTQARQAVIATPLGRRSVHVSAPHQSSVQPSACRPPADDDGKLEQSPRNLKTVVRLSEALQFETAEPSNTKTRIRFGVHREMFEDVFGAFDLSCLHRNWSMVHDLLPASRRFIQQLPCLPLTARPDALQIYVDGSYFPPTRGDTRSGWAICVLGRHADTWCWAGFITRNAAGGNAGTLLDKVASAFTTELAGILHALAICLAVPVEASIGYDCQAAGEVAQGLATAQELTRMPDIALQLFHLLSLQGRRPRMFHLRSHKGHPLNEFCDAAAKAAAKGTLIDTAPDTLHEAAEQNVLDWLWLSLGGHRDIPGLSEEGVLYDADTPQGAGPTLQHALPPMPLTPEESTRLGCRAVTYNCLSCASTFQREALDGQFHKKKCCLVGLQETRTCGPPRGSTAHFFVLASAASEGQLGCQLWLSKSVPLGWVHDVPILWDDKGLSIVFSSPRILATIAKAGSLKFAITVAHAPTSKEAATVRAEWWRQLSAVLRMAPATCTPILLIDGNAQLCQEEAPAASSNRYFFEQVLQEHQLCHSGDRAHDDTRFTTWTGPDGRTAAIDYVCVPLVLQQGVKVEGPLRHFQGLTTHDHSPIAVSLDWSRPAQAAIKTPKLDYSVLAAPDRREWWRQWMSATPVVPWSADVDNHLAHLNKHILAGLTQFCPRIRPGARGTITSGATWDAIRDRRQLRRMQHSLAAEHRRAYLRVLFLAWRTGSGTLENSHVARLNIAFIGLQIRAAGKRIRGLARQDAAHHTRDAFVQARGKGPEALHHLLRQVVKVGRKYKKPALQPSIQDQHGLVAEDSDLLLGRHFATAERATESRADLICTRSLPPAQAPLIPVKEVTIARLARAFGQLTCKKAPGISGVPPEAFRFASLEAARSHYPLLLKMILRGQTPNLWRGGRAFPIEKPKKDLSQLAAWRSILLVESGAKAIAKAIRPCIIQAYRNLRQDAQGGSLPKLPLQTAMGHIRGYVKSLRAEGKSGGVIFVDGQSAFYSTLRQRLLGNEDTEDVDTIQWLAETCFEDESSRLRFAAAITAPGLLSSSGTPEVIRRLIISNLDRSWFATGPAGTHVFATHSGTVPGAPLADVLFQEVFTTALVQLRGRMADAGVLATFHTKGGASFEIPSPSWMDDLSIPVVASSASRVVPNAQTIIAAVATELRDIGISMNLCAGKTELVPIFAGHNSRTERRKWLTNSPASFPVVLGDGSSVQVHFASTYVHLGAVVDASGGDTEDIHRRRLLARELLKPQMRIYRNPHLSQQEKCEILIAGPLARLRHGAGLWDFKKASDRALWAAGYMEILRRCFRQITGISSKGIPDEDICSGLGMLTAAETRQVDILRHAGWLLAEPSEAIAAFWFSDGLWKEELEEVLSLVAILFKDDSVHLCNLRTSPAYAKLWARRLSHHWRSIHRKRQAEVLEQWRCFEEAQHKGWIFLHVDVESILSQGNFQCTHCQECFLTPAALAAHCAKVHSRPSRASQATNATRCEVCSQEFWSTQRLHLHLRKSKRCLVTTAAADLDEVQRSCMRSTLYRA
ncbi:hypothetical protein AK812_SmicGene18747 [Symbiodinium microadriaticum]|uniref:RNase H type-1 domain-containing protein n=1 Tax=Symbiodinium microadriaticum TaxID=2951 RepID=A0A1Q9DUD1_SYMMI|nr:hypothetical protein AK812_SmicGene18747 [Symbiodinium microadriaticum]